MRHAEPARALPVVRPPLVEHGLDPGVVLLRVEVEVVVAAGPSPAVLPAGQRARLLAHVLLGVGAAVGAEGEELHHLAAVVLVRRLLDVLVAVQPEQHRRVRGHLEQQLVERREEVAAEQLVLLDHQLLAADAFVRRREPVVPDERHPLDERAARAHHPVEPPAVILAPGVVRREWMALVVVRLRPDELLPARVAERVHGTLEAELRERLRLARPRPEARAPEQPLGVRRIEAPPEDRQRHRLSFGSRPEPSIPETGVP